MLNTSKLTRVLIKSPGIKHVEAKVIKNDNVWVMGESKNKKTNKVRYSDIDTKHAGMVGKSFKKGIDYSKNPPIVIYQPQWEDGVRKDYRLICGFHRYYGMLGEGITEWIFDVYTLDGKADSEFALSTLQVQENNHVPEKSNSKNDLINIISYLINIKQLDNNEMDIESYVEQYASNMHFMAKKSVVAQCVQRNGAYADVKVWPFEQLKLTLEGDKNKYKHSGVYDIQRKAFGFSVLEGYEHEFFTTALRKLVETNGTPSYFICHTKAPTEKRDLKTRRQEMVKNLETYEEAIEMACAYKKKHGDYPWRVEAFLKQDIKNKEKDFLSIDEATK